MRDKAKLLFINTRAMKTTEYKKMANAENTYWWHVGRKDIINRYIRNLGLKKNSAILNIGCGTGGTINMLEKHGILENVDTSQEAVNYLNKLNIKNVRKINGLKLPYKENTFDLIVALDVLEHIKEDSKALKEWHRVLKPKGKLLITVPAYQWLWSNHDESLHHYRRYTLSGLHRTVNSEGFKVKNRSYIIVFSFPLIVTYRFIASLKNNKNNKQSSYVFLPAPINNLFVKFLVIEGWLLKYISFPFGTSALIEATK